MVRQLAAELHIDTSKEIVSHLHQFMSKFHLIYVSEEGGTYEEAD